jgi:anti-anti-sigma factor
MDIQELKSDGVLILTFQGRLDGLTSNIAQERIAALLDRGETRVIIDLGQVEYISSIGLRVFMTAGKRLKSANGKLAFCSLQDWAMELFEIAGFASLFSVYLTREEALEKMKEEKPV